MIRVVMWDNKGKAYLSIADKVQIKTFDKKIEPIISEGGIGRIYVFEDKELPSTKFRKVMNK